MSGFAARLLAVVTALVLAASPAASKPRTLKPRAPKSMIAWQRDLTTALEIATRENRQVIADFYADWCQPCKVLERKTLGDPGMAGFAKDYVWVRIDVEKDTSEAIRYSVKMYPTLIVMRGDGSEIDRIVGLVPPDTLKRMVEDYVAGRNTLDVLLAEEKSRANDPTLLIALGDRLSGHGRDEEALARYRSVYSGSFPDSVAARAGLEMLGLYLSEKKNSLAVATAESWLQRFPHQPQRAEVLLQIGSLYADMGDRAHAVTLLRLFLQENPFHEMAPQVRMAIQALE